MEESMNQDMKRALLGEKEAAKWLTEKRVLVPRPGCGGDDLKECYVCGVHFVTCQMCDWTGPMKNSPTDAHLAWNIRVPILNAEELEMLEGME